MYFADLSPYTFLDHPPDENVVNVGWLDNQHSFPTGRLDSRLLDLLFSLCLKPVRQTRGFHQCLLCPTRELGYLVQYGGKQRRLGSAEIRLTGSDDVVFASPDMIFHYIRDHDYMPPGAFVKALEQMTK